MQTKLKELLNVVRNKNVAKKMEASKVTTKPTEYQESVTALKKTEGKLMVESQQLVKNLNCLINENNKLKTQVDSSRNSRVIYSNVYKTL